MITERDAWTINGYLGIVILAVMTSVGVLSIVYKEWGMGIIFFVGVIILASGLTVIQPNESVIVQFAGNYVGTYRQPGIVLFIPFSKRISISLREQIIKCDMTHVHDEAGIPVSMSIVLLFKIVDAAKAFYDVEDLEKFIEIQSEMSVRNLMTSYDHLALLTDDQLLEEMTDRLKQDLYDRLQRAGIALTEIRLIPVTPDATNNHPAQLTEKIMQFIEKEKLLPLDEAARRTLKTKLTMSLSGE